MGNEGNGEKKFIVIDAEEFECRKNIAVNRETVFVPCLKENRYFLNIDIAKGRFLWGGQGCEHYNNKVGTGASWEEVRKFCIEGKKTELKKKQEAEKKIKKYEEVMRFLNKLRSKHMV